MTSAREAILHAIQHAVSASANLPYDSISRRYRQADPAVLDAKLELLQDRLQDYGSRVYRCTEGEIPETIGSILEIAGKRSLLIPVGIPSQWLPATSEFRVDRDLPYDVLDSSEGVLTECALAISETGTIVLDHTPETGRRALTLIPDYHLCVIRSSQVVDSVVEGIRLSARFATTPITTISGCSATSDIEMTRVKGVHGPRTLDVLLVT
jgi:L-lactate dehydrogenase complex protein LldG